MLSPRVRVTGADPVPLRGWEKCAGVPGPKGKPTYHDSNGAPIINNSTFPDMKGLVAATADAGGVLDWYLNNCGPCPSNAPGHIAQDVAAWDALGFGGTKVDGCDVAKNISEWYQALLATNKPFLLVRTPQRPHRKHPLGSLLLTERGGAGPVRHALASESAADTRALPVPHLPHLERHRADLLLGRVEHLVRFPPRGPSCSCCRFPCCRFPCC